MALLPAPVPAIETSLLSATLGGAVVPSPLSLARLRRRKSHHPPTINSKSTGIPTPKPIPNPNFKASLVPPLVAGTSNSFIKILLAPVLLDTQTVPFSGRVPVYQLYNGKMNVPLTRKLVMAPHVQLFGSEIVQCPNPS